MMRFFICILVIFVIQNTWGHEDDDLPMTWPPQPLGITNVINYSDVNQETTLQSAASTRMESLTQQAILDPKVKQALGNKFTRVTQIDRQCKGKTTSQVVFFSHDKKATVEVEFANEKIRGIYSTPAGQYQPEITDEEAAEAVTLARNYYLNQANWRVFNLQGYSILAYKPDGVGFYDTRVIYVSFHVDNDSPPLYMAWVDLTNQQIIKTAGEVN